MSIAATHGRDGSCNAHGGLMSLRARRSTRVCIASRPTRVMAGSPRRTCLPNRGRTNAAPRNLPNSRLPTLVDARFRENEPPAAAKALPHRHFRLVDAASHRASTCTAKNLGIFRSEERRWFTKTCISGVAVNHVAFFPARWGARFCCSSPFALCSLQFPCCNRSALPATHCKLQNDARGCLPQNPTHETRNPKQAPMNESQARNGRPTPPVI
jgi:hypothetical protein